MGNRTATSEYEQPPPEQGRRRQNDMAARTTDAQTRDWEHDWQDTVNETLKTLTAQQQQTAIALSGILTRLESIEKQPEESRQRFSLANQGLGTIFGLAALIGEILQHITFH